MKARDTSRVESSCDRPSCTQPKLCIGEGTHIHAGHRHSACLSAVTCYRPFSDIEHGSWPKWLDLGSLDLSFFEQGGPFFAESGQRVQSASWNHTKVVPPLRCHRGGVARRIFDKMMADIQVELSCPGPKLIGGPGKQKISQPGAKAPQGHGWSCRGEILQRPARDSPTLTTMSV